jgi:hypothetical protein
MIYNSDQPENKMSNVFNESAELKKRKEFSHREVGLTHPDNKGFMRIADGGEIEIFAAPGIGIVINPNTRSISFFADSIKFFCRDDDGLRWNDKSFNPASDVYNEPALLKTGDFLNNPAYHRTNHYLNNLQDFTEDQVITPITIIGEYGLGIAQKQTEEPTEDPSGMSFEQKTLLDNYAKTHSDSEVDLIKGYMEEGYSFATALEKVNNNDLGKANNTQNFPWITNDLDK